jgi:hypothetical protein
MLPLLLAFGHPHMVHGRPWDPSTPEFGLLWHLSHWGLFIWLAVVGQIIYWLLVGALCLFCWRSCTYRIKERPRPARALDPYPPAGAYRPPAYGA